MRATQSGGILALLALLSSCGRIGFDPLASAQDAAVPGDAAIPVGDTMVVDRRLSCERPLEDQTIALYDFNSDSAGTVVDALGSHSASIVGSVNYVGGPNPACGQAMQFSSAVEGYGLIADDPAWQLSEGAVDFWFRASAYPGALAGLVSRDAGGTATPGHLGIFLDSTGRVGFRLQAMDADQTFNGGVCSEAGAVALDEWNHLGVNFGGAGPELWLNGSMVDAPGMLSTVICQTGNAIGINGNNNPWTFGVNSGQSQDGTALPVVQPFDGAMDHLRISSRRLDFTGPAYAKPSP